VPSFNEQNAQMVAELSSNFKVNPLQFLFAPGSGREIGFLPIRRKTIIIDFPAEPSSAGSSTKKSATASTTTPKMDYRFKY
jgi:hypothetical protein